MAKITYTNKETLNSQPSIATKNKVTSDDMNEIKQVVNTNYGEVGDISNLNTTNKTSIVGAINENKENIDGIKGTILWTNSNPSNSFAGQQITLSENIANYDLYEVIFVEYAGNLPYGSSGRIPVTHTTNIGCIANVFVRRSITAINENKLTFGDGQRCTSFNGNWITDNVRIIPVYVIGYKLGIFN